MDWTIKFSDVSIVAATLLGPVFAVQAQKWLEKDRESRKKKEAIFRTLMATRAARLSTEHVQALNMIDLEFSEETPKVRSVRTAWNEYRDHLNVGFTSESFQIWWTKADELFVNLLYEMSVCVGYRFDKSHIRKSAYSPDAHGNLERDNNVIRAGLVSLFTNKFALPTTVLPATDDAANQQAEANKLLIECLRGQRAYKVEVVNPQAFDSASNDQS